MSSRTRDYADRHPRNGARRKPARGGARKAPARGGGGKAGLPAWAWTVVGLSVGLVIAAFVYISRPAVPMDMAPSTAGKAAPKAIELPPKEPSRFAFYEMLPSYEVVVSDEVLNAPPPKPPPKPAAVPPAPAATASPPADDAQPSTAAAPAEAPRPSPVAGGPHASAADRIAALQAAVAEEEHRRARKPAPTPSVETPAGSGRERWLIQVAAYRSRADAEQQRAALALAGLSAQVEQVTIDNSQTWYRVRVGPYGNAGEAQAAQRTLQAQGLKGVVMKIKH